VRCVLICRNPAVATPDQDQPQAPRERCAIAAATIIHQAYQHLGLNAAAPTRQQRFATAMAAYPIAGALVDLMGVPEADMPDVPRLALSVLWARTIDPALPRAEQASRFAEYITTAMTIYEGIVFPAGGTSPSPQAQQLLDLTGKTAAAYYQSNDPRGIEAIGQLLLMLAGMIEDDVAPGPFVVAG
jgi:hypothetical protein